MYRYRVTILSGEEYAVTVLANNAEEAKTFAENLDIEELALTGEVNHVVTECDCIEDQKPQVIKDED